MAEQFHPPPPSFDERPLKRPRAFEPSPENASAPPYQTSEPPTDNEPKRRSKKQTLSCAECRRLKLKCDRVFPCQSCVKRGCGAICPDGALQSGRGSRFILANTEQLHDKIVQLSERVKQLEDGLDALQASVTPAPHPLLHRDLLRIRTSIELYPAQDSTSSLVQQNGSNELTTNGQVEARALSAGIGQASGNGSTPPGNSNESSSISRNGDLTATERHSQSVQAAAEGLRKLSEPDGKWQQIPLDIAALSNSFPVPWHVNLETRQRIRNHLPPRTEAQYICKQARINALWQYNLDGSDTFITNIMHHVYTSSLTDLNPRRLAVFLMLLAIGTAVDLAQPLKSPRMESYYQLARASMCEIPIVEEPTFDLLRAMFYMIWYMLNFGDNKNDVAHAWTLMGLLTKSAQGIGLHRDSTRVKIIPEEIEQRRAFFWELSNLECRLSLSLGRPPSLAIAHSDCLFPSYSEEGVYASREEAIYHEWKHAFYLNCLNPILEAVIATKAPPYEVILQLDKQVRDFPIPSLLDRGASAVVGTRFLVMQGALVSTGRDIALLQLHRNSFNKALSGPDPFTMQHQLAPSVLATFFSACSLIACTESLFAQEPQLSARFLGFWFNTLSAGIALSLLVARAPACFLAPRALHECEKLYSLWIKVGGELPCTCKAISSLERSSALSRRVYMQWRAENAVDHQPNPISPRLLPASFQHAHNQLQEFYNLSKSNVHPPLEEIPLFNRTQQNEGSAEDERKHVCGTKATALPSTYQFNNNTGLSTNALESVVRTPSPTSGSKPGQCSRVIESLKFDFGDLTDHSYMAWF